MIFWNKCTGGQPREARVYVDAAVFDPRAPGKPGPARILTVCNEAGAIAARVRSALRGAAGVVVIDQGSEDGTPHQAAQAGALVILQEPGISPDQAVRQAVQAARRFSKTVQFQD